MSIRPATGADAPACAAIYAPYVTDTATTFELEPPDPAAMAGRIEAAHVWLVSLDGGRVTGYAHGGPMHSRPAYRWSVEVSIYLEMGRRRTGTGRELYEALLGRLAARGFRTAVAAMAMPNAASEGLHRALGFEPVGVLRRIGWKHGAWHDVAWLQRPLGDAAPDAPPDTPH